jgi:hypothetical protein
MLETNTMSVTHVLEMLISFSLLVWSVAYRSIIWIWLAPPAFLRSKTSSNKAEKTKRRISSPLHDLQSSYDVVVTGSGYGGGVAASRMARAQPKLSVCVLERGDERWPEKRGYWYGGFPSSIWEILSELRITLVFRPLPISFGKDNGLYRWICGRDSNAFVANGQYTRRGIVHTAGRH